MMRDPQQRQQLWRRVREADDDGFLGRLRRSVLDRQWTRPLAPLFSQNQKGKPVLYLCCNRVGCEREGADDAALFAGWSAAYVLDPSLGGAILKKHMGPTDAGAMAVEMRW